MEIHDTFADFILFLYVHMSQADSNYDPQELAMIKSKMGKLFSENTDLEKKLYGAIKQYKSFEISKFQEFVSDSLRHFSKQGTIKEGVYSDLYEIIQADGKLLQSEMSSLEALKKMIDHEVSING